MAWKLYTLGRWCFEHRGRVIAGWLVLLILAVAGAVGLSSPTNDKFELGDTESSQAFDLIKERSPGATTDGATARLVIQAPEGEKVTDDQTQALVTGALKQATTSHVAMVADPYTSGTVSQDGRTAYATISFDRVSPELDETDRGALEEAAQTIEDAGLTAVLGGDALVETPEAASGEIIGVVIAFIVLTITFGSLVAAGMPLVTALMGVGIGFLGITTLSGFVDLSSTTPALATMLGLAVGIDYALFIMSRFQHEVRSGRAPADAAGRAVGTAGSAVIFAGLTVIIALVGLSVVNISFLTQMGLGGAATVLIAVLIALTLLPAILSLAGARVNEGRVPGLKSRDPEGDGGRTNGRRWVDAVTRRRWPVLITGLVAAAVVAIPVASMELALPDDGSQPTSTQQRQAYDLISANFGAGSNGPLTVVVDTAGADDPVAAVEEATADITSLSSDVAAVVPPVTADSDAATRAAFTEQIAAVQFAIITVIPQSGPSEVATKDLVNQMRDAFSTLEADTGARALVTGQTAVGVDISQVLADAFPVYLAIVVGLAFILLIVVFRSILVPLKATLGFLLSVGISLGATVAVFQWGWLQGLIGLDSEGPVIFILPLLLTGILFGLAMDYEVFLVTRMREEYVHGTPARQAVVIGFQHSARVVTAAALIMMGVFGGFALGVDPIIKTIGFALTIGVLADAFLVRMTLVPALMSIVGDRMWWLPSWLDRALPNLDIEGEGLAQHLEVESEVVDHRIGVRPGHE